MQRCPAQPVAEAVRFFATSAGISIRHDHDVIFRAAKREHPLACRDPAQKNLLRHGGAADESAGLHERMIENGLDGFAIALHDVEHAIRQAGLVQQFGK